jgi:TonB family protein
VTLLETLTQHRPVWDETKDWEPPLPQTIPAPFLDIARACLRRDPERRWTVDEIAGALRHNLIRRAPAAAAVTPAQNPAAQLQPATKKETLAPAVAISKTHAKPERASPPRKTSSRWAYVALLIGGLVLAAWIGPRLMNRGAGQPASAPAVEQGNPVPKQQAAAATVAEPLPSAPDIISGAKEKQGDDGLKGIAQAAPQAVSLAPQAAPSTLQPLADPVTNPAANAPTGAIHGEVLDQILPDVPQSARDTIQGTIRVSVAVHVDAAGEVTGAELTSEGPSKYFAGLALKAAQLWKFNPAEAGGRSVPSTWILRFEFARDATRVVPSQEPL